MNEYQIVSLLSLTGFLILIAAGFANRDVNWRKGCLWREHGLAFSPSLSSRSILSASYRPFAILHNIYYHSNGFVAVEGSCRVPFSTGSVRLSRLHDRSTEPSS